MIILAVETATLTGSVALLSDNNLLGETTLSVSVQHSERLMPAIEQLLKDANVSVKDIDLYAVSTGPGSFTGLRIGLAAVQGLALAHGKPVIGVSTLEGLARNGLYFPGLIVPMLNAFRGEIYWGLYRSHGAEFECLKEDQVTSPDLLMEELRSHSEPILAVGNGVDVCGKFLVERFGTKVFLASGSLKHPRASHVGFLASLVKSANPGPVLPRYHRKPG